MRQFILRQNVLSDNVLSLADEGKVFKGGFIAIVKEYKFQSAWSDREEVKRFRTIDRLLGYLEKHYTKEELMYLEL